MKSDRGSNELTFFHMVGRYGSKDRIKAVLKWAEQDVVRLKMLETPITGNKKGWDGFTFLHLVGRFGTKETVKAALNCAGENNALLKMLKRPITENVLGTMGTYFFTWLQDMDQKIVLKRY